MNITLGDEIKFNDEVVPDHLLKALFVVLQKRYQELESPIAANIIMANHLQVSEK
ncbi:hypothetical protein P9057_08250 [Gallibacterium anatis]|jgi:hypothetical protein|uniref:Uncharacterized protein n=2 Tax=Gallibacterium anatis TaxID=750 RepID=U1H4W3_9PAST|nr:hypothetical protein [Gallibacterium anatis]ERF79496.1 hypothetical protein N561_00890 [Gallibacterium anatis 12656/12]MBP4134376.1 hypothetical protein [Gallibacterium anatis]MDK9560975.1 hypothetical protein [Gallibacterium anatis]HJF74078.1 hypothetical protein [Gallibacterium anatis]